MHQLILAAGKGSRLNNSETNKCFTKIHNKMLLDYNLELSTGIDADKIIVVVGHNWKYICDYISTHYRGIPVSYVHQHPQLGIAHAVKLAISQLQDSFFMCLSDEILIQPNVQQMKAFYIANNADCVCGMVSDSMENIQKAYTMDMEHDGTITRLVEKPTSVFNKYKGTGYCMMSQSMLTLLEHLSLNAKRNEYEMGDWIQLAVDKGLKCMAYEVAHQDFNINEPEDILLASRAVEEDRK